MSWVSCEMIKRSNRYRPKVGAQLYFENLTYLKGSHDMPCRAFLLQKVDDLSVGGRCISTSRIAVRSTRGMATDEATGTAAGCSTHKNRECQYYLIEIEKEENL